MTFKLSTLRVALLSSALAGLVGCAHSSSGGGNGGLPDWAAGEIPIGCGLGNAKNLGNLGLTRDAAVDKARADLSKSLQVKVEGMLKQYADQGESGGEEYSEQKVTQVTRTVVDQTLGGTSVKKTAVVDKEYYALVCMDLNGFKGLIDDMNTMNAKAKQALKARADAEFADLDRVLRENRGGQ